MQFPHALQRRNERQNSLSELCPLDICAVSSWAEPAVTMFRYSERFFRISPGTFPGKVGRVCPGICEKSASTHTGPLSHKQKGQEWMSWAERWRLRTSSPEDAGRQTGKVITMTGPAYEARPHAKNLRWTLTDPSNDPITCSLPRSPCFRWEN